MVSNSPATRRLVFNMVAIMEMLPDGVVMAPNDICDVLDHVPHINMQAHTQEQVRRIKDALPQCAWRDQPARYSSTFNSYGEVCGIPIHIYGCKEAPAGADALTTGIYERRLTAEQMNRDVVVIEPEADKGELKCG